jgi:long-chain acyl-CoA synthetase
MAMSENQFWRKSWDSGLTDLDPALWETHYVAITGPTFRKFPNKTALVYMGAEISFADLDRKANQFAQMLIASGLKKGDVVGINLPNIPEYVIAWLGTLRAGCVVSGVSPLMSAEEVAYQMNDSQAKALVTLDAIFAARIKGIADKMPGLKVIACAGIGDHLPPLKRILGKLLKKIPTGEVTPLPGKTVYKMADVLKPGRFSSADPNVNLTPDDTAYIQYTGGTTGAPKGAMLTHRNSVADLMIVQSWLGWKPGEGLAVSGFPFFHIAGLFFNINCIYLGWTQVLVPNPRDTKYICDMIVKYRPTTLVNVPTLYQLLMADPRFKTLDYSRLEICISAASPFPEESQRQLEAIVGPGKLLEVYGMTETSPLTVMNPAKNKKKLGAIGLPILNTDLVLKEPGTGRKVEIGEAGEICVKGPMVMKGYFNKPEETAKCYDEEGYFHSGDVAIADEEGYFRIVDRTKDMIIVGGFKVFSRKVEDVLCEHPAVDLIALVGVPNPERPGSELVMAFVTLKPGADQAGGAEEIKKDIMRMAKERLAAYEVPKEIEIRSELPLTTVGKIDKKKLRAK